MAKREWGRRRVDNQPYPKTRDKDVLPRGLWIVPQTRKIRVHEDLEQLDSIMVDLGNAIRDAESERNADAIYVTIRVNFGDEFARKVWDHYVDWNEINWSTRRQLTELTEREEFLEMSEFAKRHPSPMTIEEIERLKSR